MATLKSKDIKKMTEEEREKKLKELRLELVKSKASASKAGSSKIRQIKRIIARILTLNREHGNMSKMRPA
jgi:large subunit ribosomal protein L29